MGFSSPFQPLQDDAFDLHAVKTTRMGFSRMEGWEWVGWSGLKNWPPKMHGVLGTLGIQIYPEVQCLIGMFWGSIHTEPQFRWP